MSLLPQFGFIELLVLGVVALIVVGPKELPALMRQIGQVAAKARRMASEFTSAFDQMAREAEMDELRKEMEELRKANPVKEIGDEVDLSVRSMTKTLNETVDAGNKVAKAPEPGTASGAEEHTGATHGADGSDAVSVGAGTTSPVKTPAGSSPEGQPTVSPDISAPDASKPGTPSPSVPERHSEQVSGR